MERKKLMPDFFTRINKIKLGKRCMILTFLILCCITVIWGFNNIEAKPQLSPELIALEKQAENGDTVALHQLLRFYDENSEIYMELVEAVDADGNEIDINEVNEEPFFDSHLNELYQERLQYWLNKGLAVNDPEARRITAMRLYYEDESEAIKYLSKLAEEGDGQAALFCGSACFNQGKGEDAFKYLTIAYEKGVPSAGWHLAMCYSQGFGTEVNKEKATEVLRQSALLDFPEAVWEMKRIEPNNPIWQSKADSLDIDFGDYEIIDD